MFTFIQNNLVFFLALNSKNFRHSIFVFYRNIALLKNTLECVQKILYYTLDCTISLNKYLRKCNKINYVDYWILKN